MEMTRDHVLSLPRHKLMAAITEMGEMEFEEFVVKIQDDADLYVELVAIRHIGNSNKHTRYITHDKTVNNFSNM